MFILTLQFRGDLGGHGSRFIQSARLEADGADTWVAPTAIAFTDSGEVVIRLVGRPGIRPYRDFGAETRGTY